MKTRRKIGIPTSNPPALLLALCALLLLWGAATAHAQCPAENRAFLPGETLDYDLYFNWKFIWKKVGTAGMTTTDTLYADHIPAYRFDMYSISSKKIDFIFRMRDTLTCYVTHRLEPLYFRKGAEEGRRYTIDEAWFSYDDDSRAHVHQRRTYRDGSTKEMTYSDNRCIFDMLSILAQARSFNAATYQVGDKINFPMATGRRVEEQTLIYRGMEDVEAKNDTTYRCLVFSFVEYDDRGKEDEIITFFVTDDDNHLPIRLDMYLSFGSAKIFLRQAAGLRYSLASAVVEKKKKKRED